MPSARMTAASLPLVTMALLGIWSTADANHEEPRAIHPSALTEWLATDPSRATERLVTLHRLIVAGADVDFAREGDGTPLIIAAKRGDVEVVKLLLEAGARVDQFSPGDGNPLIAAASRGRLDVAKVLVAHGAAVDAHDRYDESPLINAARQGHLDVATYLLRMGADATLSVLASTIDGVERRSPMSEARKYGHANIVALLMRYGAT